jgi:predicted kinase
VLIVISGLPGTGKTTLARALARRIGAAHLSVDAVEDALLGAGLDANWTTGVAAYEAVRTSAQENLSLALTVVVDAVNDSEAARQTWRDAANTTGVALHFVVLRPPPTVEHQRRLHTRTRHLRHVAEPTWGDVMERARTYAKWEDDRVELSACESVQALTERVQEVLRLGR